MSSKLALEAGVLKFAFGMVICCTQKNNAISYYLHLSFLQFILILCT